MKHHQPPHHEKSGAIFALLSGAMLGLFPVFVNRGVQNIPPIFFAGISTLLAAMGSAVYVLTQKKFHEFKKRKAYPSLIMVTLFIVIIPYILFFVGASKTSGLNTSVLLLSEIIFTVIFTHFYGEKTCIYKVIGAGGVFLGALFILYNGKMSLNVGDALIIISTICYPIGNFYAKKVLYLVSSPTILLFRFTLAGIFLTTLSFLIEPSFNTKEIIIRNWPIILFNGFIILGVGKILWYAALKRLDISKAISLEMTFPLFSLATLVIFFNEQISVQKWLGIGIMMVGVLFSILRKSADPAKTKYNLAEF